MQSRSFGRCSHKASVTTITAGMAREVCETCARVRIYYVDAAVQVYSEGAKASSRRSKPATGGQDTARRCILCSQPAVFMIPEGMTCDEHAWQAAARLDWDETDPWVPIRIDRSNA